MMAIRKHFHHRRNLRLALRSLMAIVALLLVASVYAAQQAADTAAPSASAAVSTTATAVPAYRQANKVAVLTVEGVIDNVTLKSLERRIKRAVADGADAVVLDINTPGGEMFATLEICSLLKSRAETPANVVAWVNPTAYSAGTIIALACREIVVAPGSTMGDAAPIDMFGRQMNPTERAKLLSPLLTEIVDSARRNHFDENLVQAFVMLGKELWMIENSTTGERVFVEREEYRRVFGEDPPTAVGPVSPSAAALASQSAAPVRPLINQSIPRTSDHAALTPEEAQMQIEFEKELPPARLPLTEADRSQWRLLMQVTDGTTLLTIKPDEAVFFGLASAVIGTDAELQNYFGAQSIQRYDELWSEGLVRFLISLPVRAILIAIFLICLFIELAMPGFGVFGIAAIVALLIFIGAPALVGLAQWWDTLLIVLGILLVIVELFLIPGFGVPGVLGALCLLVGLIGTFVTGDVRTPYGQNQLWNGMAATFLAVFLAAIGMWWVSRFRSLPIFNRFILNTELKRGDGAATSADAPVSLLEAMRPTSTEMKQGDLGVAETDLRPSGRAIINGRMFDVQSVGTYIEKNSPIRVVSIGRYVIEVEEAAG